MIDISIVVPLYNEEESLPELESWIKSVMTENNFSYEVIMIDDGSNDKSWEVIQNLSKSSSCVKGIRFRRNYGKSAALHIGFQQAVGDVVITMDADLQDSPDEIPDLYRMIKEENFDLISGWKKKRYDPINKTLPSKLFNKVATIISGVKLHDFNCGLKAYKNEVIKTIEVYGEMHRYIPFIANQAGFRNIGEKVVQHQARKYGYTKFGISRFIYGFLDLISIWFISKFGKRPMHFFGSIGTLGFLFGFFSSIYLGGSKILALYHHIPQERVTSSPYFYISIGCMIIGTQLFLAGFLGELISRNSNNRNTYQIKEKTE